MFGCKTKSCKCFGFSPKCFRWHSALTNDCESNTTFHSSALLWEPEGLGFVEREFYGECRQWSGVKKENCEWQALIHLRLAGYTPRPTWSRSPMLVAQGDGCREAIMGFKGHRGLPLCLLKQLSCSGFRANTALLPPSTPRDLGEPLSPLRCVQTYSHW